MVKRRKTPREVLIPGALLSDPQPGKFHGRIVKVVDVPDSTDKVALICISDLRNVRLQLPLSEAVGYAIPDPGAPGAEDAAKAAKRKRKDLRFSSDMSGRSSRGPGHDLQVLAGCRSGAALQERIAAMTAAAAPKWPPGTRLWVKLRGSCSWPVVMWSAELCRRRDFPALLASFRRGHWLVRFYGEQSLMWVADKDLVEWSLEVDGDDSKVAALRAWGRQKNKTKLIEAAVEELEASSPDCRAEVAHMMQIHDALAPSSLSAALDACGCCMEDGAALGCPHCERNFHPLCLTPPALTAHDVPEAGWCCPACGEEVKVSGEVEGPEAEEKKVERMGLTPDWIIEAGAFSVFQLERPTAERPYIKGLLDPCTNSMVAPNIPAEILYDKQENGLKLSNKWAGSHIILNPDYSASVQWRFVNRAIDEVENEQVPAVLLICRNSTDTAYFQRLRPYPRVLLRRLSALFKDYDKTPIGFGVVVFCIAKTNCRQLYERFYDAFASQGEPNIPIDQQIMRTPQFYELLDRLRRHADKHHRDHWIQCSLCSKWRILDYSVIEKARECDWTCKQLRPPYTSCRTPQNKRELAGGRYAAHGADFEEDGQAPGLSANQQCFISLIDAHHSKAEAAANGTAAAGAGGISEAGGGCELQARGQTWQVACPSTLTRLAKLPHRTMAQRIATGTEVLTALELARNARMAANRAYLAALAMEPADIHAGRISALAADDPVVLAAAREMARKAALAQAQKQVETVRVDWEAKRRARAKEEARLQAALLAVQRDAADDLAALQRAETALQGITDEFY